MEAAILNCQLHSAMTILAMLEGQGYPISRLYGIT